MSMNRIMERWARFVIEGEGKERSDANERYSYRGPVLYSNEWPVSRLVKGPGKTWVCVTRSGAYPSVNEVAKQEGREYLADTVSVPCIGVFSKYDGDMLPDSDLHKRINWLAHCAAQRLIEQANLWPADKIVSKPKWYGGTGAEDLTREMTSIAAKFDKYSKAFNLGWLPFPDYYGDDLDRAIKVRMKAYNDPKAVTARERQVARRQAKEALLGKD